jgi:threonine synthase
MKTRMTTSLAITQRSLGDPNLTYPLWPPLVEGCPKTSTADIQYPLTVAYDTAKLDADFFDQPPMPGLERWQPLLPPLAPGLSMGEGGTPLISLLYAAGWTGLDGELFIKNESLNPTGSHKDRLNLCTVSAAVAMGAPGVVVASSGNHGAAAAAYAARAGLPCVLFITEGTAGHIQRWVSSYGAAVVPVAREARRPLMRELVRRTGFHPVSNITPTHTGHPFGPEGYKTIAYELFQQLGGRAPAAVFVPTAYAELLYGVWSGFKELHALGRASRRPEMVACEPAAAAPLRQALQAAVPVAHVDGLPTDAYSIAVNENSYRGVLAVQESEGMAVAVTDVEMMEAQQTLARQGLWAELSGAASLAALRQVAAEGTRFDGPVVCLITSSGFKDQHDQDFPIPTIEPEWNAVRQMLQERYNLAL